MQRFSPHEVKQCLCHLSHCRFSLWHQHWLLWPNYSTVACQTWHTCSSLDMEAQQDSRPRLNIIFNWIWYRPCVSDTALMMSSFQKISWLHGRTYPRLNSFIHSLLPEWQNVLSALMFESFENVELSNTNSKIRYNNVFLLFLRDKLVSDVPVCY